MVPSETMSSIAGILTDMQNAISDEGVGDYAVSANSVIISKISILRENAATNLNISCTVFSGLSFSC